MINLSAWNIEDWAKVITLVISVAAIYYSHFYKRVKLNAFFINSGALKIPGTEDFIHTHTLVIRNNGKLAATNVEVIHDYFLDEFSVNIYPKTKHESEPLEGGRILKIERIRPTEELTLSYLYPKTVLFSHIGHSIKHDDGKTEIFPVKFAKVLSKPFERFIILLLIVGLITTIWIITKGIFIGFNIIHFLQVHQLLN